MERLMVLQLESGGCPAEVLLNGMPVAALGPLGGRVCIAVHEYTLAGKNQLALVICPAPQGQQAVAQPRVAIGPTWARARLVLIRKGQGTADANARALASVEWGAEEGKSYEAPTIQSVDVDLPVAFPRWRWLDAPVVRLTPALTQQAHAFVTGLARDLARGQTESFMAATRLRTEELALAYQRSPESEAARLRESLEQMYASSRLVWQAWTPEEMQLQPLVDGRLLECLGMDGRAALTTMPDKAGNTVALPLKLSVVEGRFYVLR